MDPVEPFVDQKGYPLTSPPASIPSMSRETTPQEESAEKYKCTAVDPMTRRSSKIRFAFPLVEVERFEEDTEEPEVPDEAKVPEVATIPEVPAGPAGSTGPPAASAPRRGPTSTTKTEDPE